MTLATRRRSRRSPPALLPAGRPLSAPLRRLLPWLAAVPVLLLTLHPSPDDRALGWDGCLLCGGRGAADALLNLLLFAPFGAALALRRLPLPRVIALGALFSVGVETAQLFIPGRDPSPPDLLFNTLGTLLGVALGLRAGALLRPRRRDAGWLALLWATGIVLVVAATGGLSRPSLAGGALWAQWTPEVGDAPPYPGTITGAWVGAELLLPGRLREPGRVRAALLAGEPLTVHVVAARPPPVTATLLRLADGHGREILRLDVAGVDLLLRVRTVGDALRFDRAPLRVRGALAGLAPGETVRLSARLRGSSLDVAVEGGGAWRAGPDAGHGWALLGAALEPVASAAALAAGWVALLFLPLGFWLRPDRRGALAGAVALAALLLVPGAVGLLGSGPAVLAGAVGGTGIGWMLRRAAGRRHPDG